MARKTSKQPAPSPRKASKKTGVVGRAVDLVKRTLGNDDSQPSAISLLTEQHQEVKGLFKSIEAASSRGAKAKLFEELAHKLVAHDAIEREIFYPACERAMGMTKLLGEALVEHGVVEFCLFEADQAQNDKSFAFKCQVLSEIVLHHAEEEEDDFFPEVKKALSKADLEKLGARMKERFDEAKDADFRAPLHRNLQQVLAGAIKPGKGASSSSRVSAPSKSRSRRSAA